MTGGSTAGGVGLLLRAEGAAVAIAMAIVVWRVDPQLWIVAVGLLAPDVAIAGYLLGPRIGALLYNAAHAYLGPAALAGAWLISDEPAFAAVAALWALHIGVDRMLGFGLKHPAGFGDTHLGRIGRR
mgnify:FL=1